MVTNDHNYKADMWSRIRIRTHIFILFFKNVQLLWC